MNSSVSTGRPGHPTPDLPGPTLVVMAYPEAPTQDSSGRHFAPRATAITIRAGGPQRIVVAPRTTETLPGATPGVRAVFAYEDFAKIHLGDFEVVVLAGNAERVCTVDATARASIK